MSLKIKHHRRSKKSLNHQSPKQARHVQLGLGDYASPICGYTGKYEYFQLLDDISRPRDVIDLDDLLCDDCLEMLLPLLGPYPMNAQLDAKQKEQLLEEVLFAVAARSLPEAKP